MAIRLAKFFRRKPKTVEPAEPVNGLRLQKRPDFSVEASEALKKIQVLKARMSECHWGIEDNRRKHSALLAKKEIFLQRRVLYENGLVVHSEKPSAHETLNQINARIAGVDEQIRRLDERIAKSDKRYGELLKKLNRATSRWNEAGREYYAAINPGAKKDS